MEDTDAVNGVLVAQHHTRRSLHPDPLPPRPSSRPTLSEPPPWLVKDTVRGGTKHGMDTEPKRPRQRAQEDCGKKTLRLWQKGHLR